MLRFGLACGDAGGERRRPFTLSRPRRGACTTRPAWRRLRNPDDGGQAQLRSLSTCFVYALVVAAVLGMPPAAAAAPRWSATATLSAAPDSAAYPQVGLDARGDATAVWMELKKDSAVDYTVMSSTRPAGSAVWSKPIALSAVGRFAGQPRIAVDSSGAAVVVWVSDLESLSTSAPPPSVQAATRTSASGAWTSPAQISRPGVPSFMAKVGVDAKGDATALWFTEQGSRFEIQVARGSATTGQWSRSIQLAGADRELINPQLEVNPHGDAVAVWEKWRNGGPLSQRGQADTIMAATLSPAARWSRPASVGTDLQPQGQASASFEFPGPQVSIDGRGDAMVVWQDRQHGMMIVPEEAFRPARGRWQRATRIATVAALLPQVDFDSRGDATAIWEGPAGSIVSSTKPVRRHRWSRPVILSKGNPNTNPYAQLTVNARGDAVVSWSGQPLQAAVRLRPTGPWSHPVTLGAGGITDAALDPRGDVVVVWARGDNRTGGDIVQARSENPAAAKHAAQ